MERILHSRHLAKFSKESVFVKFFLVQIICDFDLAYVSDETDDVGRTRQIMGCKSLGRGEKLTVSSISEITDVPVGGSK